MGQRGVRLAEASAGPGRAATVVAPRRTAVSDDEGSPSGALPWVMAGLVLIIGGAKLDAARPFVARILAISVPVVPVVLSLKRVEGGNPALERAAKGVGWLALLTAEACVASSFFHVRALGPFMPAARGALYAAAVGALGTHILEARVHGKARFAGYIGIVAGYGVFISQHVGKDPFATVFGAFFVGVFVGGAALLLGELLGRVFRRT